MGRSRALVNDTEARMGRTLLLHASWHVSGFWNSSVRLRWPDRRLPELCRKDASPERYNSLTFQATLDVATDNTTDGRSDCF